MADPYLAEIRVLPFNFAPKSWAFCDGQLLSISQNTALFSLLGTNYGGNGTTNFGLPNLQNCAAMHPGQGPGRAPRDLGETGGESTVTLTVTELPAHTHALQGIAQPGSDTNPESNALARGAAGLLPYVPSGDATPMLGTAIGMAGGSLPHNNMMPFLVFNFCIAMQGIFPPRN